MGNRGSLSKQLEQELKVIPDSDDQIAEALEAVKNILDKIFAAIRCMVADQMQLYSESFFLLPMLRRLEGEMATLELLDEDRERYRARKEVLEEEKAEAEKKKDAFDWSIEAIEKFQVTVGST